MGQRVVMKFLVNEDVKPADIYRRLQAQYGDETLSRSKTSEWCKRFKDGRTSISDDPSRGGSMLAITLPSLDWPATFAPSISNRTHLPLTTACGTATLASVFIPIKFKVPSPGST
jgi:hypothetical protein